MQAIQDQLIDRYAQSARIDRIAELLPSDTAPANAPDPVEATVKRHRVFPMFVTFAVVF